MQAKNKRFAVLFVGQGSQSVGMLKELSEQYPVVLQTFSQASEALGFDLWAICQDEAKLGQTQYTQPALLTASMAIWQILQADIFVEDQPLYLAGHSLGEYSALCASGVLSLADAVNLVYQRGQFMQSAVLGMETLMAAVLGLEDNQVVTLCEQVMEHTPQAQVSVANFNSQGQVVIAGNRLGVELAIEQVQKMGKKAVPLKVSVPSHSPLMKPASELLAQAFDKVVFHDPKIPVIQNRYAKIEKTPQAIKQALIEQLSEPVLWTQTMQILADKHIDLLVECGSGNVLSNLAKRQATPIECYPTDKPERIEKLKAILTNG